MRSAEGRPAAAASSFSCATVRADPCSDPAIREETTNTLRQVGKSVRENEDLISTVLPTGDGLLLAVKR